MWTDTGERVVSKDLRAIQLICMFCGERRTIHVPHTRVLPEKILWECLACQKKNGGPTGPPGSSSSTKRENSL